MTAPYRDRIDFISAYCDRWCERCAFTTRCSAFAVTVATGMCDGDAEAGLELALGAPPAMTPEEEARRREFLAFFDDYHPTEAELDAIGREEAAREERVDGHALVTACERFGLPAYAWLTAYRNISVSAKVAAAIEVMGWDALLIQSKLRRALSGRDRSRDHEGFEEDSLQSDWNGSAKVALISIARSIRAWEVAAEELQDDEAAAVAAELRALEAEARKCFPDAWRFRRPGFDDPAVR